MAQIFLATQPATTATWTSVFTLYWALAVMEGTITLGALVFFAIRYRSGASTPQFSQEDDRRTLGAVLIMVVVMAVALGSAAFASFNAVAVNSNPPNAPNAIHVNVIGSRFQWYFQYLDGRQAPGQLVVFENTVVILNITSVDVPHSLGIPALRVKADAIPGKSNTIWFSASAGMYLIQCYELCGAGHAGMIAHMTACSGACV